MIVFLLFALTILSSSVVVVFYKSFTEMKTFRSDLPWMIFWSVTPLSAAYAGICLFNGFEPDAVNFIAGGIAGICNVLAMVYLIRAMTLGSLTLAVILINLNFVIPILLSVIFLKESVSPFQIAGILLMAAVIVVTNLKGEKKGEENPGEGRKSLVFALIACLANGLLNFMVKVQQFYLPGRGQNTFYAVLYGSGGLVCLVAFAAIRFFGEKGVRRELREEKEKRNAALKIALTGGCIGACSAACLYPLTLLTKYVNASVQFTVITSGAVLLSLAIAFLKYREKPNVKNIVGTICCLIAIFLQLIP